MAGSGAAKSAATRFTSCTGSEVIGQKAKVSMELWLRGDAAVVFGAASGIGLAIARAFADEGAIVTLVDRDERVRQLGRAIVADVTDYARMQEVAVEMEGKGPVRHVVF